MTTEQKNLILATVPILKEHGVLLTTHFYARMFKHNPELKNVFNIGNQQAGKQQTALAMAVLAYAENIADPMVLLPVVDRIGHKHTSLDIRPEHYIIVGNHLLASIQEVLGEAATPAILDAWKVAYNQLAALMSGYEATLYKQQTVKQNGWTGWRLFKVGLKQMESAEICSFYLYPADGGKVTSHEPGQYLSIKLFLPELKMNQIRQYSISNVPTDEYYRISVKRETGTDLDANGLISNRLHDEIQEGDLVELTSPAGSFTLPDNLNAPVTFISGGVGLTPFVSMVHHLAQKQTGHPITWLHGCRSQEVHAFKHNLDKLVAENKNLQQHIFYNNCTPANREDGIYEGYLDINHIDNLLHEPQTHYFICGPSVFIKKQFNDLKALGVDSQYIFFEEFGPQLLNLN
ncbi:NO-inducible flavohemoprotein [Mucilaginibacter sp. SP1R1]|uniref:NO-inducible flavohemoprotein n=1 Tax=Mucilaginibacter sp. SP1R1 TaxID=2723091 RepID=UPI00161DBCAA|nr:NO-inducible flavohemoprotein [Mucilaginibacter sp. SP1R1]MBB6147638.1 nitric oxide dioxygenase [Mucilaginibacter sp. SP1R1]